MSPRSLTTFLKSKFGLFLVFLVFLFVGLWLYGRHQQQTKEAEKLAAQGRKKAELGTVRVNLAQGLEDGTPREAKADKTTTPATRKTDASGIVPFKVQHKAEPNDETVKEAGTKVARTKQGTKPKRVRQPSLLASYETPSQKPQQETVLPPERFIPYGTLLKCKLVNTVDSSNLETPVIALLLEDVWQNGRKVIPANTLIHGFARAGRMRDRVTASGTWRFVWQDGRELAFNGIALDREYDHEIDGYGITDGSGGIRGRLLAADDLQELKMMASAALSGFARGTQDRTQTALGSTITGSVSNGVREGVGEVFDLYARRTLKDIEENGYFVRVPAGKEFYVYVRGAVDPAKSSVAGVRANRSSENKEDSDNAPISETKG